MPSGIMTGWGTQWETLANAINDYYGGGISSAQYQQVAQMLNSGNYTMSEMESILGNIPEFERTYNSAGQLVNVSYKATAAGNTAAGSAANAINSNAAAATNTQFKSVQTITKDSQTGKVTISDSVKKYNNGVAGTTKAVASSAVQGVMAASVGIKLGKTIDQAAYDAGFNWLSWAGVDMESLNPSAWAGITAGDDSTGAKLFNFIFGIDPYTGNPQGYIDQNAFAYMTAYMMAQGVFDSAGGGDVPSTNPYNLPEFNYLTTPASLKRADGTTTILTSNGDPFKITVIGGVTGQFLIASEHSSITYTTYAANGDTATGSYNLTYSDTKNGKTVYYSYNNFSYVNEPQSRSLFIAPTMTVSQRIDAAWVMVYGGYDASGGVEGITSQDGATQFNTTGLNDPSNITAVLAAILTQYPELWDNRIEVSPDGDSTIVYLPVGFPTGGVGQMPTTNGATASDLAPDISGSGDNATDELIKTLIEMIQSPQTSEGMDSDTTTPTTPIDPNMPTGGTGNTPVIITPTGSASALYSIYNPTQGELNSFGAWLWSSNFVDQLLKIFNDPMQAIIGLHKVFATPPTSGTGEIKVGYLGSGVTSSLVSNQYTEIDCGSIELPEYFLNVLDYTNTDVNLYLPFIGIVPLNVLDIMRGKINVKYNVDVLTGACLACVNVTRDSNAGGQLYTYGGNCAVQYPLSSGSYMGIVTGILGVVGSVAGTIASGGALLPMALGVGASAFNGAKTNVQHSGSISGSAGAMGIKKPYLIIRRPQTAFATDFETFDGLANNKTVPLSSCSGFTRVKSIHIENIPATSDELTEIEIILKDGVII